MDKVNNFLGFVLVVVGTALGVSNYFIEMPILNLLAIPTLVVAGFVIGSSYYHNKTIATSTLEFPTQKKERTFEKMKVLEEMQEEKKINDTINWVIENKIPVEKDTPNIEIDTPKIEPIKTDKNFQVPY